jgi:peptidoglycan/LPS O-acetylase OafA/YrhL
VVGACVLPVRRSRALRALEWRPLALLGVASYSLYVWHEPIVHGLRDATGWGYAPLLGLSLAVCVPIALLSYRLIEAPFLALRRRWAPAAAEQRPEPGS